MSAVISTLCLLYLACGLLYQADERRAAFAMVKHSKRIRFGLRFGALVLFAISLLLIAPLQGWVRGAAIWLGLLSFVFVLGLFIAAQRPSWHAPSTLLAGSLGLISLAGSLL